MSATDVRVVTATSTGLVDCAKLLSVLLKEQGALIKEVKTSYAGNKLRVSVVDSADVPHEAEVYLPIPTRAETDAATNQLVFKDAEGKELFRAPLSCVSACTP